MSDGSARAAFVWGDGELYNFRLALEQLRELQDKTGVGPYALYTRLAGKDWRVEDIRQTIRLGLIGGGMEPPKAATLVKRYVDERPLLENVHPALFILHAALIGADGDTAEKKAAAEEVTIPATGSPSPQSSEVPAQSV